MSYYQGELPETATGLQLCKMRGEELILCEEVQFIAGISAVDTTLRRASISGKVVVSAAALGDFWADIKDRQSDMVGNVALDAASYRALKTHWMRCKEQRYGTPTQPPEAQADTPRTQDAGGDDGR